MTAVLFPISDLPVPVGSTTVTRPDTIYFAMRADTRAADESPSWLGLGAELRARLTTEGGWAPNEGSILQQGITPMRSFVVEPMRYRRPFLAGNAAHIVPLTGAKGLNLAGRRLAPGARAQSPLPRPAARQASRTSPIQVFAVLGRAQRFSSLMTMLLHRPDDVTPFDWRRQHAELEHLVGSRLDQCVAENYVGFPPR